MKKKLIVIVGLPGSGKSTAAEFIKKKFNSVIFHSGDVIREEIRRRGLKYTPKTDALVARWFHRSGREKLLVSRIWGEIEKSNKKLIVVEGLRSYVQLRYLERVAMARPFVIAILASFNVRLGRELKRKRFGKDESVSYLRLRERIEKSHGIEMLIKKADYKIDNSKLSIRQTNVRICKIVKEILTK